MKKIEKNLSELAQSSIALFFLYNAIAHVTNHAYSAFSGKSTVIFKERISFEICSVQSENFSGLFDTLCGIAWGCFVGIIILYYILKWVCETEWVKEPIEIEECWKEVKWYNPFSWIWVVVCVIKESFRWVLQRICGWKRYIVWGLGLICVVVIIAAVL